MTTKKISQLEYAADITASDLIQIVDVEDSNMAQSGTNKKATAKLLATEVAKLVDDGAIPGSKIEDGTITPIKIDSISNELLNNAINEDLAGTMSVLNAVSKTQLSTNGGASKVFQATSGGTLITGTPSNSAAFAGTGNILIPDLQGIRWLKKDGTVSGASIRMWQDHDGSGGELIIDVPWRIAIIPFGPFQIGNNASSRDGLYLHIVSGSATSSDTLRSSKAIGLQTNTWSGSTSVSNQCAIQAVPLDTTGTNSVIRFYQNATIVGSDGASGVTPTMGNATGTMLGEMHSLGLYTPGTAPSFDTLTDGPAITQVCSRYKTIQVAKVTLGGNRTLDFSKSEPGMRGVIYVSQDGTGSRTLTPAGGTALDLSSTANYVDRVNWEFDGLYYNFSVSKNIDQQVVISDPDAAAFITAAALSNPIQRVAISSLVESLKGASLWSVWHALYPFIGGSSATHAINLKNPGTHNITWVGGVTHNANGITGDGTSGYGNTNLNANSILSVNSTSLYAYCRTQTVASGSWLCGATTSTARLGMVSTGSNLQAQGPNDNTAGNLVAAASNDFRKHLALNRSGASSTQMYANSSQTTGTQASISAPNQNIAVLAANSNGTYNSFAAVNLGFFAVGGSLSSSQWSTFRGIINSFQSALGRSN